MHARYITRRYEKKKNELNFHSRAFSPAAPIRSIFFLVQQEIRILSDAAAIHPPPPPVNTAR